MSQALDRPQAHTLAVLPDGATGPEGLAVGPDGNLYVGTFGYNAQGEVGGSGQLYVFTPDGDLIRQVSVAGSTSHLVGLAFQPHTGRLLVLDAGAAVVREVNPLDGSSSVFMTLATLTAPAVPNGIAFRDGDVFVTDSAQGIVWTAGRDRGAGQVWVQDQLLTTDLPPFGANGIVFNHDFSAAFVANTGNDTIVRIPVQAGGEPGTASVLTNGVNGADGIAIDGDDNLWIAANQNDEIVVVDPTGKLVARLGDFGGVVDGTPLGLLFPATPAFSADGRSLYVTNLALDLRVLGIQQAVDSQWRRRCGTTPYRASSMCTTSWRPRAPAQGRSSRGMARTAARRTCRPLRAAMRRRTSPRRPPRSSTTTRSSPDEGRRARGG